MMEIKVQSPRYLTVPDLALAAPMHLQVFSMHPIHAAPDLVTVSRLVLHHLFVDLAALALTSKMLILRFRRQPYILLHLIT